MKSVLLRAAKRLSYIEDARCLKVKGLISTENIHKLQVIIFKPAHSK